MSPGHDEEGFDHDLDWDDDDDDEHEDVDCHAGNGRNLIEAWQRCGMAGTEYCDFECKFAASARAAIRERQEKAKARRRSHTPDIFTKGSA